MISVIMPTMRRPQAAVTAINSLYETTTGYEIEVICIVDEDKESVKAINALKFPREDFHISVLFNSSRRTTPICANQGLAVSKGEYITFSADDIRWGKGWLDAALKAHAEKLDGYGLVGLNDLHHEGSTLATNYLADRKFVQEILGGAVGIPTVKRYASDAVINTLAKRANKYYWERDAVSEHLHHTLGKRPKDSLDSENEVFLNESIHLYEEWTRRGYKIEWESIIDNPAKFLAQCPCVIPDKVSVAIICDNEEDVLAMNLECLVAIRDILCQVVIVDDGSIDGTLGIIESYKNKLPIELIQHPFDNFRAQKNRALDKCLGEWVLGLDSDMAFNSLKFRELFLARAFDGKPLWDFSLIYCRSDLKHYCISSTSAMPTTRFWKNIGLRYERDIHEYLVFPGETGWGSVHNPDKMGVNRDVCILETHMLKSLASLKNRVGRYNRWREASGNAGIPLKGEEWPEEFYAGRQNGIAPIEQKVLDGVPSQVFEMRAAKGEL